MKKILSFILAVSIIFSLTAVKAAFNDIAGIQSENDIRILEGIGIIDSGESYKPESYITRGDFFVMTARILGYTPVDAEDAASYLGKVGIVSGYGNGDVRCNTAITYNEALKILVTALGYEYEAVSKGGWHIGYVSVASRLKLVFNSDIINGEENVTRSMAATLLVRAGDTETANVIYSDNDTVIGPIGGGTLFYEYLKVFKISGIVNANSATSITDPTGIKLNQIKIGGDNIDAGNTNAKEYLGYYVDAYCVKNKGYKALAVVPTDINSVLRISSSKIICTDGNLAEFEINYYTNDNKEKSARIADYDVIYNGCANPEFVLDDLIFESGEVILLNNDADSSYDVVFINQYESYVVEAVDRNTNIVFDRYSRTLDLSKNIEQTQIIDADGNLTDINSIYENDILSVKRSKNNEVISVFIVRKTISGVITGMNTSDGQCQVTINDMKYYVSKNFEDIDHTDKIKPYMGLEAVFYLDVEGKIAHIDTETSSKWKYGYIVNSSVGNSFEDKIHFLIYTTNSKFEEFEVQDKVTVDGNIKKVNKLSPADDKWMSRQLIRYQAEGNIIKGIDTATPRNDETDDTFNVVSDIDSTKYISSSKMFYSGNETLLGGTDNTIVFTIPSGEQYFNDPFYYIVGGMSSFSNGTSYSNLDAYNVNDAGIAEVIVCKDDGIAIGKGNSSFVFVESVLESLNEENEVVQQLLGLRQSGSAYSALTESADIISSDVKPGDVVRIREKKGKLINVEKTVDFDAEYPDVFAHTSGSDGNSYYDSLKIACGYIIYSDNTHVVLSNEDGSKNITFALGNAPIMLYDADEEKVRTINAAELDIYQKNRNANAKVYIITRNGAVTAVMVRVV